MSAPHHGPPSGQAFHQTARLCLLLLPIWIFGAGELLRFASLNAGPGPLERNGLVKGRDFIQFYVIGTLAREGAWHDLYDVGLLKEAAARIVPAAAGEVPVPVYGPQVALFFAPLTRLPYLEARWWWFSASAAVYLLAAWLLIGTVSPLRGHRALAWITLTCNPALAMLLSVGQTSAFGVLAWALAVAALSRGRLFLFGMCLGLLAYKPPLLFGPVAVLLLLCQRKALAGVALCALGQVLLSAAVAGIGPWQNHVAALADVSQYFFLTDTLPHQKQSLLGFFWLLPGSGSAAVVLTAIATAALLSLWWRHRGQPLTPWFVPLLTVTSVLVSPHLYVYDLLLLTPGLLVAADALARRTGSRDERTLAWAGYLLLYAPFSGVLALHTGVQISTIVLLIFFVAAHRIWISESAAHRRSGKEESQRRKHQSRACFTHNPASHRKGMK